MVTSYVLIKKIRSTSEELSFTNFKLWKIGATSDNDLEKAQRIFPKAWPSYEDYVYEKTYVDDNGRERAPSEIEDTLLLMRLFKTGDLFFVSHCLEEKDNLANQLPNPIMVYTPTTNLYNIEAKECAKFNLFASDILSLPNWSSEWFKIARRFFLYGGGKEYNPRHGLLDRIVDYITVLETILVPEKKLLGRRLRERAAALLKDTRIDTDDTKHLLRDFYNVRSVIVHGSDITSSKYPVLERNMDFEQVVRQVLVESLRVIPNGDERNIFLKDLF